MWEIEQLEFDIGACKSKATQNTRQEIDTSYYKRYIICVIVWEKVPHVAQKLE